MTGGFLDVAERDTGVERGGDERVPQGVGSDPLGDPGPASDAAHDPARGVPIESVAVGAAEDRSFAAFTDGEIDRPRGAGRERDGHDLAALAQDRQGAVAAFEAELFDVGAGRFGDAQPVECQQADERVVAGAGEPGRDQQGADLVAVQARGVRLVVEARTPHVHRR